MLKINPAWQDWQITQNEGGEGYNPHPKWIEVAASPKAATTTTKTDNRMLRDERGNYIPASKLAAAMERDIARLDKITDATARAIVEAGIAHARAQLGA